MTEPKYKVGDIVDVDIGDPQFDYGPAKAIITGVSIGRWGAQYSIEMTATLDEVVECFLGQDGVYNYKYPENI